MRMCLLFLLVLNNAIQGLSQTPGTISLQEVIAIAQQRSAAYKLAQTQQEVSYYQFLTYKSNLKPQISLYGSAPVFVKQYTPVIQPDGKVLFLPLKQNTNRVGFSLSQVLPFTGGSVSLNTELYQFYDFQAKYNQYNGTPVFLQLNQPLFALNTLKWQKKIEPLKLQEAKKNYVQEIENIAQQTAQLYFNVLDAQTNIQIANSNMEHDNYNYAIEQKRVNLGTTTEDKLLQLELQTLKGKQSLEKANYDFKMAVLALQTYIGYKDSLHWEFLLPEQVPVFPVQLDRAIAYARLYRAEFITFKRRALEATQNLQEAKAARQQVTLTATYGLNRAAGNIGTIYSDSKAQQTFSIGINVPIVDWGRTKARYNTAVSLEKLAIFNNEMDSANIVQEITTLVNNIELLKGNIQLAKTTDSVARRRFNISNNLYQAGKLTVTELNIAQSEKDNANRSYISALRDYWNSYYQLRRQTMFDFQKNIPLPGLTVD